MNLYVYVLGNPVNLTDPEGLLSSSQKRMVIAVWTETGAAAGMIIGFLGGGGFLTGPGAVAAVPAGAYAGAAAGGVAGGIIAEIVAKGVLHIIDSGTGSSGCQDDDSMFGSRGTQVTSKTVWQKGGSRIDVENPNPGQRPGQIHFQIRNEKYLYDSAKGNFQNAPNWVNKLLKSREVQRAISKALKILGEL